MAALVMDLARPYRVWLVIIMVAMLVETIAGALVAISAAWLIGVGRFERNGRVTGSNAA